MVAGMLYRFKRSIAARNTFWLYCVHVGNVLVPLVTVPFLARMLRPAGWGLMVYAQGVCLYLTILTSFGFNASATRAIARVRYSPNRIAEVAAGVMGAKAVLSAIALLVGMTLQITIPVFRHEPLLFYCAAAWGIFSGVHALWYFQGIEDLKLVSIVDILCKSGSAAMTFSLVRGKDDAWIALALMASAQLVASSIMVVRMYRQVTFIVPTWRLSRDALNRGWHMFLFSVAQDATVAAGPLLVGSFSPPVVVGFYSGAERLTRVIRASLAPAMQSLFPRLSYLAHHDLPAGKALIRRLIWVLGGGSIIGCIGVLGFAPWIVRIALGPGYEQTVPLLRLFAVFPPMSILAGLLGNLWAHPLGLDRPMTRAAVYCSVATLASGLALVPHLQATGMVISILIGHVVLLGAYYNLLARRQLLPFRAERPAQSVNSLTPPLVSPAS